MIIENLSQRSGEFQEAKQNIVAIETFLSDLKNKEILLALRESRKANSPMSRLTSKEFEKPTANDIAKWLDDNSEKVISRQ